MFVFTFILFFQAGITQDRKSDFSPTQELHIQLDSIIPLLSVNIDSAYELLQDIQTKSKELNFEYGIAESHRLMGYVDWNKGDLGGAIKSYSIAQSLLKPKIHNLDLEEGLLADCRKGFWNATSSLIDLYSSYAFSNQDSALHFIRQLDQSNILESDTAKQAQFLQSKAIAYQEMGRYKDAIENGLALLQTEISDATYQAELHLNACMMISRSYDELEEVTNARKYIQNGLEIGHAGGLGFRHLSPLRNNYAVFLMEHAESVELGGDGKIKNPQLLFFADSLIKENLKDDDLNELYEALYTNTLAESTFYQDKFEQALSLHTQAANVFKDNGYTEQYATIILNMALCEVELGNYDRAIALGKEGLQIKKESGDVYYEKFANEVLYRAYKDRGNYRQSLTHFEDFTHLRDSIKNDEKLIEITDLETSHQLSEKEKELQIEKSELALETARSEAKSKAIMGVGIGSALLLILLGFLWKALQKNMQSNRMGNGNGYYYGYYYGYKEYWTIWIDLNNDGDFEDYGEEVFKDKSHTTIYDDFEIPNWATGDTTTMRIAMRYRHYADPCEDFDYGEVEDYSVVIGFCNNVDNGGSIAGDQVLCENDDDPQALTSVSSATGGSGAIEYLWLSNVTGSTPPGNGNMNGWVEIPNSNSASYDPGPITETTWYLRCARRAGCVEYPGESNIIEVVYTPSCQVTYCDSYGQNSAYEWIESISINYASNVSGNDGGFGDYRSIVLPISTGLNGVALSPGYAGQAYKEKWTIWIDFNNDGDFEDANEEVFKDYGYGDITGTMTIPSNVLTDTTTMRIAMKYNDYSDPCEVFEYGEVEDYSVVITTCDNITDGGTIDGADALCDTNNDPGVLGSVQDANGGSGTIEYVWLSNTTGAAAPTLTNMNGWVVLANSNSASYDPGPISESTRYLRCARRTGCENFLGESNIVEVTYQNTCQLTYCGSTGQSTQYEWIDRVQFGSIDNASGNDGGYADYRSMSTTMNAGSSMTITLTPGFAGSAYKEYWRVWVDWNQDGDFNDPGEKETQKKSKYTINRMISAPNSALNGVTTMRVSMKYGSYPNPCETFGEGEVEDYTIIVQNGNSVNGGETTSNRTNPSGEIEIENGLKALDFSIFPNPTLHTLNVEVSEYVDHMIDVNVLNGLGQVVMTRTIDVDSERAFQLDVSTFKAGMYTIIMKSGEKWKSEKFIKVKQ